LTGAPPTNYNPASGGIPGVTSPIGTVTGNLGNLSSIIGSLTGSQNSALRGQYPGEYFGALGTLLGNVGRRASGDISDLIPELQQSSAEAAVAGGVSGSGMENTKLLRDLGLTRYGVEEQALKDLGQIQSELPLVRPYDPNDIIRQQLDAQERADLYRAAPDPEAAYQRANQAAGGGGGGGTGPIRYGGGGGAGAGVGTVDDALRRRMGGGSGPPIIAHGTMQPGQSPYEPAPYGTMPGTSSPGGWDDILDPQYDPFSTNQDFGGSLSYGGGNSWDTYGWNSPANDQTRENYETYDPWFASLLDIGGGNSPGGAGGNWQDMGLGLDNSYTGGGGWDSGDYTVDDFLNA
jgi:hypothetical protein